MPTENLSEEMGCTLNVLNSYKKAINFLLNTNVYGREILRNHKYCTLTGKLSIDLTIENKYRYLYTFKHNETQKHFSNRYLLQLICSGTFT